MDTSASLASYHNSGQAKLRRNHLDNAFLAGLDWDQMPPSKDFKEMIAHISTFDDNSISPLCLAARASTSDNPTFTQAMNGPDADGFRDAMNTEMGTLDGMESWIIVRRTYDINILGLTWLFKVKHFPKGTINKLKALLCVRGDQEIDRVDMFNTYALDVSFSTVRLILILSIFLGWATAQINYTAAFINASVDEEVYEEMPRGYCKEGHMLKLQRSLYGLKQSPRNFFKPLLEKLNQ
eukprot:14632384-Ditylum_brightwellii.AAC.1